MNISFKRNNIPKKKTSRFFRKNNSFNSKEQNNISKNLNNNSLKPKQMNTMALYL